MLTSRRSQQIFLLGLRKLRCRSSSGGLQSFQRHKSRFVHPDGVKSYEDDFTPEPIYPSIDPIWNRRSEANKQRHNDYMKWIGDIRKSGTVEGKAIEFNMPHRYGYYCFMLNEDVIQYDSLPFHQYITRTHLIQQSEFPDRYSSPELLDKVAYFSQKLNEPLLDILKFEFDGIERKQNEDEPLTEKIRNDTESIVNQVSRLILQVLSNEESYFQNIQVDWKPKTEAFWLVGGFARSKLRKKQLSERPDSIKYKDQVVKEQDPVELNFQYLGNPLVQIRSEYPIGELIDEEELSMLDEKPLNRFKYSPQDYYATKKLRHATNVAGHWSGDKAKCNLITFHSSHHLYRGGENRLNNPAQQARTPILLHSQGVLVSFTKLLAQACSILGYDQFAQLSEPLSSQTIITNGQDWSFYTYQLNTLQIDKTNIDTNNKQNICWGSPSMKILDSNNGKLNQNVVDMLLKFYLLPTLTEKKLPFMPYIKCNLNEMKNDVESNFIHFNFQGMYSQKGLILDPYPEIYLWEKFYKIDNQTRPLEARKRFFENPDCHPYWARYRLFDPRIEPKMLTKMKGEVAAKKEEAKVEAVKLAQKAKYHQIDDEEDEET